MKGQVHLPGKNQSWIDDAKINTLKSDYAGPLLHGLLNLAQQAAKGAKESSGEICSGWDSGEILKEEWA